MKKHRAWLNDLSSEFPMSVIGVTEGTLEIKGCSDSQVQLDFGLGGNWRYVSGENGPLYNKLEREYGHSLRKLHRIRQALNVLEANIDEQYVDTRKFLDNLKKEES